MFGWLSRAIAFASCLKRATNCMSTSSSPGGSTLMATTRSSARCRPRYTAPMPPRATKASTSYCGSTARSTSTGGGSHTRPAEPPVPLAKAAAPTASSPGSSESLTGVGGTPLGGGRGCVASASSGIGRSFYLPQNSSI